jgi:hypothetical protein
MVLSCDNSTCAKPVSACWPLFFTRKYPAMVISWVYWDFDALRVYPIGISFAENSFLLI